MYINLLYLYLILHIYSFFLFFLSFPLNVFVSFIFIALFPNWHLALVLSSSLCFSFVLVDTIFGFLCLSGQYIVLYFCWTVLILLMGVYVYIQSHFLSCYKPLPLHWAFAVLWSFPFFFFSLF